jgi:predicted house-cleaning NTP pyrophosphatase (Maf/HAM1 superfamily)
MSKTPDTDANTWSDSSEGVLFKVVSVEFARRLERERDEMRKELEEYRSIAENIGADKAVSEKEKAIRERDEAREAFVIATDQMVIAQCKVREANKERDEAREEVRLLKAILELIKKDLS